MSYNVIQDAGFLNLISNICYSIHACYKNILISYLSLRPLGPSKTGFNLIFSILIFVQNCRFFFEAALVKTANEKMIYF